MANLFQRLAKLEAAAQPDGGVIVMWRHVDEPESAARDRWCREHPGQDPDAAGMKVIVIRWTDPDAIDQ